MLRRMLPQIFRRARKLRRSIGPGQHAMRMESDLLTYASMRDTRWKRWAMRAIEDLSGRRRLLPIYHAWRTEVAGRSPRMMSELLDMIGTRLSVNGGNADAGT